MAQDKTSIKDFLDTLLKVIALIVVILGVRSFLETTYVTKTDFTKLKSGIVHKQVLLASYAVKHRPTPDPNNEPHILVVSNEGAATASILFDDIPDGCHLAEVWWSPGQWMNGLNDYRSVQATVEAGSTKAFTLTAELKTDLLQTQEMPRITVYGYYCSN